MEILKKLFLQTFGIKPVQCSLITGSGSSRRYFRLTAPGISAIGVHGSDIKENRTYIDVQHVLSSSHIPVPATLAISDDFSHYLLADLGSTHLFDILHTPDGNKLVKDSLSLLPVIQYIPIDSSTFYPVREIGKKEILWDLDYFKYSFAKACDVTMDEYRLDEDFNNLADHITSCQPYGNMYRDFQSRNIMIHESSPWFIDFQSMRRGPVLYDLASFLWQARASFSQEDKLNLSRLYHSSLSRYCNLDDHRFSELLSEMVLFRTLQVLGAYGLRGLTQHKAHFLQSIPNALLNVRELLEGITLNPYPELKSILEQLISIPDFSHKYEKKGLNVTVFSFSYKKGYPLDLTGNGGGFMFDCRALHNPGRYDRYKSLTGMDAEVIAFLDQYPEVTEFLDAACAIVIPAVRRYAERSFTSLQIGFGCTGGQHRSVYCAEHLAHHLKQIFKDDINLRLIHREQEVVKTL